MASRKGEKCNSTYCLGSHLSPKGPWMPWLKAHSSAKQSFLAKLGWKILTNDSNLWTKIMRVKYWHSTTFFETVAKPSNSIIWTHILAQRHIIHKVIRWKVGNNGHSILFWLDNWCAPISLLELTHSNSQLLNLDLKVSHFILANRTWDMRFDSNCYLPMW